MVHMLKTLWKHSQAQELKIYAYICLSSNIVTMNRDFLNSLYKCQDISLLTL